MQGRIQYETCKICMKFPTQAPENENEGFTLVQNTKLSKFYLVINHARVVN